MTQRDVLLTVVVLLIVCLCFWFAGPIAPITVPAVGMKRGLYIAALVCFCLAAIGLPLPLNLTALGLALLTLTLLV